MPLPRTLLEEIEQELSTARKAHEKDEERITALQALHALAADLAHDLNRTITVFDLIRSAPAEDERERRAELVRLLRQPSA